MANESIGPETKARIAVAWPDILADIAAGELVRDAHGKRNITRGMIRAYLVDTPGARAQWDEARESSADAFADEALAIARDPFETVNYSPTGEKLDKPLIIRRDSAHARTHIDTLKWAARIRNPRTYSDKSQIDMNIRTVDLTRIISDANARLAAARAVGRVIEGEARRIENTLTLEDLL